MKTLNLFSESDMNCDTNSYMLDTQKNSSPISLRNAAWQSNKSIPSWVKIENVGLDQFFTRPEIAKKCFLSLIMHIENFGVKTENCRFIEPSAGIGSFYDLLPFNRRIGIDVEQFNPDYILSDFLAWQPKDTATNNICIGNPPFGYRAWLALAFLNHAAKFSDFVGFIVPMAFQSRGKSNVQDRVNHLSLIYSSPLPADSFIDSYGKTIKVNALWQIWAKGKNIPKPIENTCDEYIDLFTVDLRKERLCGQKRMHEADFFLQRTFYTDPPRLVTHFSEVKYVCGYGIVIKKHKDEITQALQDANWQKYSNLASHNCRHISMCHIRQVLIEKGFVDNVGI